MTKIPKLPLNRLRLHLHLPPPSHHTISTFSSPSRFTPGHHPFLSLKGPCKSLTNQPILSLPKPRKNLQENPFLSQWKPCKNFEDHPILSLIKPCKNFKDLQMLHSHTITTGLIQDPFSASRIVGFCVVSNNLPYARNVFDRIESPDVFTYNTMIKGYSETHEPENAISLYFQMLLNSLPPNTFTFSLLIKACTLKCLLRDGKKIHSQILKHGFQSVPVIGNSLMGFYSMCENLVDVNLLFDQMHERDLISWNTLITSIGKRGDFESARRVFDAMPDRNLVSWAALIDAYVKGGHFLEALRLFCEMQKFGMEPDEVTVASVLCACANLGALNQGKWLHSYIDRSEMTINVVLGTALVDMYAKCGCIDIALKLFREMREKDIILWNAMIGGLAVNGYGKQALELFDQMRTLRVGPNERTFIGVLRACSHSGLVSQGRMHFHSMIRDYGINPRIEHYGCLADVLGRAGLLKEAEDVLNNMPMKPQASQLGALLAACKTHGNLEIAERIGQNLIELEPNDGGRYVLLSNIYAAANQWDKSQELRRKMRENGLKKDPGCSFIEWNGVVHEFLAGDIKHPQTTEIYAMLNELEVRLKSNGYLPHIREVLVDMDEEEKEITLSYHSEKLAIAFAFINMDPKTPIRIIKNLRVCIDCHIATKLISKIYNREIIVRDRNRFHHFIEGACSCADYW
ncbi:pentatricopeptide repeat-containing protein At5g66520-like [Amborella trichopoda]|uniref:pentatricopeptide repeat-containing protein At5g66520-like n=1 Tax=Amborella trichopoda TaxID=13333 RepID=UPI0009C009B5|nr:pentatricopeptide repeat-containing protein At5g66520-like [Amborella trichopoda]|eukprot:XP_011626680.2 pentatricopeptide repeat-containing protein At5g66520-like [Amborella trichopoda]